MIKIVRRGAFAALLTTCFFAAQAQDDTAAPAPEDLRFSETETILWLGDQLAAVAKPTVLTYAFDKTGSFEKGFTDSIVFKIEKLHSDGMKAASLDFFTGERRFPIPPEDKTNVNPVLKVYLQGDVYEMNRLTDPDGKARERWRYFQRRVKFAMAEGAQIEPIQFDFDDKQFSGKQITFAPFKNDPKRGEFERFADKVYTIIVSDKLPGYLFRIETVVPGGEPGAPPLIREVLQLKTIAVK